MNQRDPSGRDDEARARRAEERRQRVTLSRASLNTAEPHVSGEEAFLLVHELTVAAYAWRGSEFAVSPDRATWPYRFIPGART
jgi:hypothetical protein